jgi:hypothetical protein
LEFFIGTSAWYCKLCDTWIGDLHCASAHFKSKRHNDLYAVIILILLFEKKRLWSSELNYCFGLFKLETNCHYSLKNESE